MTTEPSRAAESDEHTSSPISGVGELLRAALEETDALEAAWSAALDSERQSAAIKEYKQRLSQSLKRLESWATDVGDRLSDRGLDRLRTRFPIEAEDLVALSVDPTADQLISQLWLAFLYALRDASLVFAALGGDQARRPNSSEGDRLGSFWEAGSFILLRQRISALADIADRFSLALEDRAQEFSLQPGEIAAPLTNDPSRRTYERAQALVRLGFHDAALPLLLHTFHEAVRSATNAPDGEGGILVELEPELRRAVEMLAELCSRIGRGLGAPPEVAVPLAEFFVGLLPELHVLARDDSPAPSAGDPPAPILRRQRAHRSPT